ncbi:pectate lyase-like adhesive domain-containing protein, partial [Brevibacillus reuszeri]|uniref:pectate lyase-like adhesive domain-containing protein n=1 Tax=Brevibacillus reuszeri TaxID=54915 RepID=UPI001BB38813
MKKKQLALSVMSTALVASMAASAFAAAPKAGVYIGGNVDKYYSFDAMGPNMDKFLDDVINTVPDVLYVSKDGVAKGGNLAELLFVSNPKSHFVDVTDEMFADIDGADGFNAVKEDGTVESVKRNPDGTEVPGTPGELKVESVSAINLTKLTVKFNKAVDEVSAENFSIPGLTIESATLAADKKTVTLSFSGAEVSKDYQLTITKIKIDAKVQPDLKVDFKAPSQDDLFKPAVDAKDTVLKSENSSQTLVTFKLLDAAGNLMTDAQDVEVKFSTTWGTFAEQRVTVQKGIATVIFNAETLTSDKVAEITAQVIEAKDKNLIGLKAVTSILLTPNPDAVDPTTGALMGEAAAYQADRVVAYFNKPVSVSDFVFAAGDNKGAIDPSKAVAEVYTEANNDGTGGKPVKVLGLLEVPNNNKALQLILDKGDTNFPLVDNANVTVKFTDKRGSVQVPSTKSFKLTDARKPAMLSVEREGLNKLKVVFSEAIFEEGTTGFSARNLDNWIIDGKSLNSKAFGDTVKAKIEVGDFNRSKNEDTRHVVTITLGEDNLGNQIYFKPGTHSLQGANIGDWAVKTDPRDNVMNTQTLDFDIPVDNGAPSAVVEVQSPEQYMVSFDKDINLSAANLANVLKLQIFNKETGVWEDKADPAIKVTDISDSGHNTFLVETTNDWTRVYDTKNTNKNYYNDSYRLHIDKDKVMAISNGTKNAEINLTLGGAMTFPDVKSPTIDRIVKTPESEEGTSYDVTMSEPVKIGTGNAEGETPSQEQGNNIPVPTAEFIKKDNSVTIPANIGTTFVDKVNKVIRVTPTKELEAGEWTLVVRSISDDVGNTAASATKDFKVEKPVLNTDFKVVWSYAENINDANYDFVFVKFSKEGATIGDQKNITKTANYTLNGKALPTGTQIFADIKDYDDMDNIVDSITIRLPKGSITQPDRTVINISQYLESVDGQLVGNAGIKKLPYNWGTSETVSTLAELKAALADDSLRTIELGADIEAPKGLDVSRLVNIDLKGYKIDGNVSVSTKEGGKIGITGTGEITGNLTVNTPNADFTVGSNVTVTGTTTIKDVASSTFVNNGTLGKVTIEDANGTGFVNNGTVGIVTVASNGSVTLGGTITDVVVNKGAKLNIEGTITNLTADTAAVTIVDGTATNLIVVKGGSFKDKDGKVIDPTNDPAALLKAAQDAVTALETAAGKDLTVEANLTGAEAAVTAAETAVAKVAAGADKTALEGKVTTAKKTVTDARTAFDAAQGAAAILKAAQDAVAALETAAGKDLTVEANLTDAEAAVTAAETAVAKVAAGADKTALEGKVTTAKKTVTDARTAFD